MARPDYYLLYKDLGHHMVDPCIGITTQKDAEEFMKIFEKEMADGGNVVLTTDSEKASQFHESCPRCNPQEIE